MLFLHESVSLNIFQATQLVSASNTCLLLESSLQLNLSESPFQIVFLGRTLNFIVYSGKEQSSESDQFLELPETILICCFPSC